MHDTFKLARFINFLIGFYMNFILLSISCAIYIACVYLLVYIPCFRPATLSCVLSLDFDFLKHPGICFVYLVVCIKNYTVRRLMFYRWENI